MKSYEIIWNHMKSYEIIWKLMKSNEINVLEIYVWLETLEFLCCCRPVTWWLRCLPRAFTSLRGASLYLISLNWFSIHLINHLTIIHLIWCHLLWFHFIPFHSIAFHCISFADRLRDAMPTSPRIEPPLPPDVHLDSSLSKSLWDLFETFLRFLSGASASMLAASSANAVSTANASTRGREKYNSILKRQTSNNKVPTESFWELHRKLGERCLGLQALASARVLWCFIYVYYVLLQSARVWERGYQADLEQRGRSTPGKAHTVSLHSNQPFSHPGSAHASAGNLSVSAHASAGNLSMTGRELYA